jgi:MFS family permease
MAGARGWGRRMRALALDVSPLRSAPDYRRLYMSSAVSLFGSELTFVAVPFQVFQETRSTLAVGVVALFELVPLLTLSLVGGAIADALDRRSLLIRTDAGAALCSTLLALNAASGSPRLWAVYALTFVTAALYALSSPAFRSTTPRLVPPDKLPAAAALDMVRTQTGQIAGPALGGLLIALVGLPTAFAIDALSFIVSLLLVRTIAPMPPHTDVEGAGLRSVRAGLRFLKGRPVLQGSFLIDINAMVFGYPTALFPALAAGLGGPAVLGLLYAAPPAGALVASLGSGWTGRVRRHGRAVQLAVIVWGLSLIGLGFTRALLGALVCLAAAGAADAVSAIFRTAILQASTPPHMIGRLHGIELAAVAGGPALGDLEAGIVAALTNVRFSLVSGGIASIIGVGVLALARPQFHRYRAARPQP